MIIDTITHDEAMIESFVNDPDYADYYLKAVLADGDQEEISDTQYWYDEAQRRLHAQHEDTPFAMAL